LSTHATQEAVLAKPKYKFQKRQKELDKQKKKVEKAQRKLERKPEDGEAGTAVSAETEEQAAAEEEPTEHTPAN
jgi:Skp family chaperone for outer membrane proteins